MDAEGTMTDFSNQDTWPKEIEVLFLGKIERYALINGTGEYPYECVAKDKHPDMPCYISDNGGWVGHIN